MSREIKYRGKRIKDGDWIIGDLVTEIDKNLTFIHIRLSPIGFTEDSLTSHIVLHEIDPATNGQYTGLKDRNGKEIYEGDIVKSFGNVGLVEWINGHCEVEWGEFESYLWNCSKDTIEVIGNIYENPELLEAK